MKAKLTTLILGAIFFISLSSFDTVDNSSEIREWVRLGTKIVDHKLDRDVLQVGVEDGRFKKLKLKVTGGSLNMRKMVVHYGNGTKDDINLRFNFNNRSSSRVIDLEGNKRIIKKIVFIYDTKNRSKRKAKLHVFGRR